jgi:sodium transport system permease protein
VRRTWIVARKELLDTLRDSRTRVLTLVLPLLLYPVIFVAVGRVAAANQRQEEAATLRVAVAGAEHAPSLQQILAESEQLVFLPVDLGPFAVRDRAVEVAMLVPPAHEQAVLAGAPSTIHLYFDETDGLSRRAAREVEEALDRYNVHLLREQIVRLGGDSGLVDAARLEIENVASAQEMGAYLLGTIVPYLLVLLIASAASHTAIDATAGEKERSTLETILVSAATRQELLLGKFLATFTTATFAGAMGLAGLVLTLSIPAASSSFSADPIALPAWSIGVLLLMIVPVAAFLSAVLIALGCFARSSREGQTYATYFIMFVAVLAVISVMSEVEPKTEIFLIPIFGSTQVQRQILAGGAVPSDVAIAILSTLLVSGLGLLVALRLFANERVMFRQ